MCRRALKLSRRTEAVGSYFRVPASRALLAPAPAALAAGRVDWSLVHDVEFLKAQLAAITERLGEVDDVGVAKVGPTSNPTPLYVAAPPKVQEAVPITEEEEMQAALSFDASLFRPKLPPQKFPKQPLLKQPAAAPPAQQVVVPKLRPPTQPRMQTYTQQQGGSQQLQLLMLQSMMQGKEGGEEAQPPVSSHSTNSSDKMVDII